MAPRSYELGEENGGMSISCQYVFVSTHVVASAVHGPGDVFVGWKEYFNQLGVELIAIALVALKCTAISLDDCGSTNAE